ncbi:hypothetical protein ACQP1G_25425 [Nocardia sp. CA-107356]|uniref:hypothetical protein n=1 Tax=Nocardia sp. CA-107356 TaxID=3239972 RepID=UPI003D8BA4E6
MFVQTLLLALTAHGLETCVQVSIAGYPEIVHAQLAVPTEFSVLCGLAVGYPDPTFPANMSASAAAPSTRRWCSTMPDRQCDPLPERLSGMAWVPADATTKASPRPGLSQQICPSGSSWIRS